MCHWHSFILTRTPSFPCLWCSQRTEKPTILARWFSSLHKISWSLDFLNKGEENLAFSGTTIDTAQAFDARWAIFTIDYHKGKNWDGDMFLGERLETTMCFEKATNSLRDWSRSGVFTVPVSGIYLLSLHLCSQDRKKVKLNLSLHSIYGFSFFYGKSIKHPTKAEKYLFFFTKWNR